MAEMDPQRRGWSEPEMVSAPKPSRFKRIFREREILLRSDDRVRHLRLTTGLQATVTAFAAAGFMWVAGATGVGWYQNHLLDQRRVEMAEAKLAYDSVLGELGDYQKRLKSISNDVAERLIDDRPAPDGSADFKENMQAFVEVGRALTRTLNQAYIDLDVPPEERHRLIASRDVLHGKIKELETTLVEAQDNVKSLRRNLRIREVSLDELRQVSEEIRIERDELSEKIATLSDGISRSRSNGIRLVSEIDGLNEQLSAAKENTKRLGSEKLLLAEDLAATKESLDKISEESEEVGRRLSAINRRMISTSPELAKVALGNTRRANTAVGELGQLELNSAVLVSSLKRSESETETARQTLGTVLNGLTKVAGYEQTDGITGQKQSEKALSLLGEIENLHETQIDLVNKLSERTAANIQEAEGLIKTTGLDVEKMLAQSGFSVGQGGPMLALEFAGGSSADLSVNVSNLEHKVQRWQALQNILRCTPMISPVDYYQLTSKFGKRKDPISGKKAMHKGLDLAGWPGTMVYATAAGKVTKAGRSSRYGNMVEIDHGCGIITRYGHLKKVLVKRGQEVDYRTRIGKLGSTGRSTGPHVHYEVRVDDKPLDPMKFFEAGRYVFKG